MPGLPSRPSQAGPLMAAGLLLLLLGVWLFVRVFWGGLANKVAAGVLGNG